MRANYRQTATATTMKELATRATTACGPANGQVGQEPRLKTGGQLPSRKVLKIRPRRPKLTHF